MMADSLGERARRALLQLGAREGRAVGLADLGARVAAAEGRASAYTATAVSRWLNDRQEPTIAVIKALARALEVTPEWLAFGVREARAEPAPLDLSKLPGVQPMVGPPPLAETPEALVARLKRERGAASGKRRRKANGG